MGETRITLVDEADDSHEFRVASNQAIIKHHDPLIGVALRKELQNMLGDTPLATMHGWQAIVTDGNTGNMYSGTIIDVSQYGFLMEE